MSMYLDFFGKELKLSTTGQRVVANDGVGQYRLGTSGGDKFMSKSGDTLSGGMGDDVYVIWNQDVRVIENKNSGIDTVIAKNAGTITLADNVENLIVEGKAITSATGNALGNIIWANDRGITIDGGRGNDILVGGVGADLFQIKAGNGSDAVMNFTAGWDVIQLEGYGINSFAELKAAAHQSGSDVIFNFKNGEGLVLRDAKLADLHGYDFGFAMDKTPIKDGQTYMEGGGRAQNWNGWYVHNNSWGTGSLVDGVDFKIDSTFNKNDPTSGTTFTWMMPQTTVEGKPVQAYPEVAFGVSPMGANLSNPGDKAAVFPVKVGDLVSLRADYNVDFSGNVSGYNVAYDIWLSSKPNGGRDTITNEVMVWVHKGSVEIFKPIVGTYSDGDVTYTIYHEGTYTAFVADRDVRANDLDLLAMFGKLKELGIMVDSEYLASIELGAEVVSGVGSLTINNLDLEVSSKGENGSVIVKEVTGAGQTVTEIAPPVTTPEVEKVDLAGLYVDGTSRVTSTGGLVLGKVTTSVAADAVKLDFYSDKGTLLSFDKIVVEASGNIATQHYSTKGVFWGADIDSVQGDGSINTYHYDANWTFKGAENTLVKSDGATQILHYDAAWRFTGADVVSTAANGKVSTQHYSDTWKYLGQDVRVTDASGTVSIQHYGANNKIVGQDTTFFNADGSISTYHYNASFQKTGFEVARVGKDGVVKTVVRDADNHLLATEWTGTHGADTIKASSDTNILVGGHGSDSLYGNSGSDVFVFDTAIGRGDVDRIFSFTSGKDLVVLDSDVFTALSLGSLAPSAFHTGTAAHDGDDRLIYDKASGKLFYDADGSGSGKAIEFATLEAGTVLKASDFAVVSHQSEIATQTWDVNPGEWHSVMAALHDLPLTFA